MGGLAALAACAPSAPPSLEAEIDAALGRAGAFLAAAQAADGAWRSATYANLGDGASLTPALLKAMLFLPEPEAHADAAGAALDWLVAAVDERGAIDAPALGLGYPVYAASLAVIALSQPNVAGSREVLRARDAWLALLLSHQLDESLGWQPDDLAYGGFGYALEPPAKGLRGDFDADLSSTLFALGALAIAGRHAGDPAVARALAFAERCQNFGSGDPAFDDGGFFFTPTNEYQNKAGSPGSDARGVRRYHSYGSMTADGLRALLRGGLPRDHPRVLAAAGWLAAHFDAASNPGAFEPAREVERDASYYYWCWSVAHALRALELCELATPRGPLDWTEALARELLARQRPDGSWTNRFTLVKEDDPLIATALAAAALGLCRLQRLTVPR